MFLFLSMLLSWFTCRMILFAKKAETIKKKLEFLCIQLLPFSIVFFPSSLFTWKKAETEKSILILYSSVLLPFPLLPFCQFLHSQKSKEFLSFFGVFFTEHRHRNRFVSLLVLRAGRGKESRWELTVSMGQGFCPWHRAAPIVPWEEQEEVLEVLSGAFNIHPSCACG